MRYILSILFLFIISYKSPAQKNCEQIIQRAQIKYNAGHFSGLSDFLLPCLTKHASKEQRMRAGLLLIQTYLMEDEPQRVDSVYLNLLRINPEFKPVLEHDPVHLVHLSRKYTTRPILEIQASTGITVTRPKTTHQVSTSPYPLSTKRINIQTFTTGIGLSLNVTRRFAFVVEGNASFRYWGYHIKNISKHDMLRVKERSFWIDIPAYIRYCMSMNYLQKYKPYIYTGFVLNTSQSHTAEFIGEDNSPTVQKTNVVAGSNLTLTSNIQSYSRSLVAGAGVKRKVRHNYLYADLRVLIGLSDVSKNNYYNGNQRDNINLSVTQYMWVSNYYRLNSVVLSVGIIFPVYKPRKISDTPSVAKVWNKIFKSKSPSRSSKSLYQ